MKKFTNKKILITGGTGSFGNALVKRLINENVEIRILSRDELKQHQMRNKFNNNKLKFFVGDVRDINSLELPCKEIDYIFHAAALKQVPSCEFFPEEAIKTNVIGSENIIKVGINNNVKKIIGLSTDKAVYPINAMGMCKALMEKVFLANARKVHNNNTIISIVRYGNVLMSRGSVIPLFISQIKKGIDPTITTNEMTRFLLPLNEAINMVIDNIKYSEQGDIFIKKSNSCSVELIASILLKIFKKKKIVKFIGKRHGEKIHEVLATSDEIANSKNLKDYFVIKMDSRDLNYQDYYVTGKKRKQPQDFSSNIANKINKSELEKILQKAVNE
tara:strand:+ start:8561 stop:9553 length:993 start_codon:yes stop_codon:yes gene_type:complete